MGSLSPTSNLKHRKTRRWIFSTILPRGVDSEWGKSMPNPSRRIFFLINPLPPVLKGENGTRGRLKPLVFKRPETKTAKKVIQRAKMAKKRVF